MEIVKPIFNIDTTIDEFGQKKCLIRIKKMKEVRKLNKHACKNTRNHSTINSKNIQAIVIKYIQIFCVAVLFDNVSCDQITLKNYEDDLLFYQTTSCTASCLNKYANKDKEGSLSGDQLACNLTSSPNFSLDDNKTSGSPSSSRDSSPRPDSISPTQPACIMRTLSIETTPDSSLGIVASSLALTIAHGTITSQ